MRLPRCWTMALIICRAILFLYWLNSQYFGFFRSKFVNILCLGQKFWVRSSLIQILVLNFAKFENVWFFSSEIWQNVRIGSKFYFLKITIVQFLGQQLSQSSVDNIDELLTIDSSMKHNLMMRKWIDGRWYLASLDWLQLQYTWDGASNRTRVAVSKLSYYSTHFFIVKPGDTCLS